MKIAHVVTLLSPDGSFGGPLRVAVNLLQELQRQGHEVRLFAAYSGYPTAPTELSGIPVSTYRAQRLIPATGFAGITSLGLHCALIAELRKFDVVHVHMARDLVTLPSAVLALAMKSPLVVQTHGMIDPSSHPLAAPLDLVWTRRTLRAADRLLYLTDRERGNLGAVAGEDLNLARLVNGVPVPTENQRLTKGPIDVLFVGRLQKVKRPEMFVRVATRLAREFSQATFSLVGPDEGEGRAVKGLIDASGASDRIRWEGSLAPDRTMERMSRSHIFALASAFDAFPMAILEAASIGIPSLMTEGCGLAETVREYGAGVVTDQDEAAFEAGLRALLGDPVQRSIMGNQARAMVEQEFSIEHVTGTLLDVYEDAIQGKGPRVAMAGNGHESD